ncbi:MAG TPA: NAD(P)-binding domain-containing protein, partial [Acidimicrobiales bacterium]
MSVRLAVVGGGRMGEALVGGLLAAKWAEPAEFAVVEVSEARRVQLAERFPGVDVRGDVPESCEGAVVAVKPADVAAACTTLAAAGVRRVLSIAAGVTLARLEGWLGDDVAVVRAMPNTPAL